MKSVQINQNYFAASWSELGKVYIWDLGQSLKAVCDPKAMSEFVKKDNAHSPLFQFNAQNEGFAWTGAVWCQVNWPQAIAPRTFMFASLMKAIGWLISVRIWRTNPL